MSERVSVRKGSLSISLTQEALTYIRDYAERMGISQSSAIQILIMKAFRQK